MAGEENKILDALESRMDEVMRAYEQQMAQYHQRYEQMVDEANAKMLKMVENAQSQTQRKTAPKPEAVWTKAADGQQLLVMNQAAANYMNTVFDSVGDLVKELDKLIKAGKIK